LDRFTGVKRVTVREITKRVNLALPDDQRKQAIEDAKKELNTIRGKVRDLSDFEQLARRESAAISSRSRGGLLGTVSIEFRGELFKNQLLQLKPGEVSEPFLYGAEVVIVRLDEVIPAEVQSFEEALPRVRQQYRREVMPKLADEERDRVLQEAGFELKI
jgi:parvulin-like peptidyl-prolyl isomerase